MARARAAKVSLSMLYRQFTVDREGEEEHAHDQVDPKKLHGLEDRLLLLTRNRRNERNDNGGDVDRKLELEELAHAVVDAATPHDGGDDGGKVIIHEDDVGSLLGDFGTGDAHPARREDGSVEGRGREGKEETHEKPTLAVLRAGPSLVPSPVTPTTSPILFNVSTRTFLSSGEDLARTCKFGTIWRRSWGESFLKTGPSMMIPPLLKIPHWLAMERAVSTLSPVHILTITPAFWHVATA